MPESTSNNVVVKAAVDVMLQIFAFWVVDSSKSNDEMFLHYMKCNMDIGAGAVFRHFQVF